MRGAGARAAPAPHRLALRRPTGTTFLLFIRFRKRPAGRSPAPTECPALPCPALPCRALRCPAVPCAALPRPDLLCPAKPQALPCPAVPCPAKPCRALPCPVLRSPAKPCRVLPRACTAPVQVPVLGSSATSPLLPSSTPATPSRGVVPSPGRILTGSRPPQSGVLSLRVCTGTGPRGQCCSVGVAHWSRWGIRKRTAVALSRISNVPKPPTTSALYECTAIARFRKLFSSFFSVCGIQCLQVEYLHKYSIAYSFPNEAL